MPITANSKELWVEIKKKLDEIKEKTWLDPIFVDRFDSLTNHYEGTLTGGDRTVVLGSLETITTVLSKEQYYKSRQYKESEIQILVDLNQELLVFQKILGAEVRAAAKEPKIEEKVKDRLPNPSKKDVEELYKVEQTRDRL